MTDQPGLFDRPPRMAFPAPSVPVDTSEDAADSLKPGTLNRLRLDVLRAIARSPDGYTSDALEIVCDLKGNTVRPRVDELRDLGLVETTDEKRPTRTGRRARVHKITDKGRRWLEQEGP